MARILLGMTGSVAAIKGPELIRGLLDAGHELRVALTDAAWYFVTLEDLVQALDLSENPWESTVISNRILWRDQDEWPNPIYHRGDPVGHIFLRDWCDAFLIAPLDANTLSKFAYGLSDNLLTCILRAWNFAAPLPKPILFAPAMNTHMWLNPVTRRHFQTILHDHASPDLSIPATDDVPQILQTHLPWLTIFPPQIKTLACGDHGLGAMADIADIVDGVNAVARILELDADNENR